MPEIMAGFRFLPSKVLDSDAFNELGKSAKLVLIISLSQVIIGPRNTNISPRRKALSGRYAMMGVSLYLRTCLRSEGSEEQYHSRRSERDCSRRILGNYRDRHTAQYAIFRWSDNWLTYNQKPMAKRKALDPDAKAPGYCHYPNIINKSSEE